MPPPRRERQPDAPIRGAILLLQVAERTELLEVNCAKCSRTGRVSVARLITQHGPEAPLTKLLRILAGDCPKAREGKMSDPCGAHFPQLPAWFITGG